MKCMNCGKSLKENEAKLFLEVLVCTDCCRVGATVLERGQTILRRLNILLADTVRSGLTSGKIRLPREGAEVVDDQELLRRVVGVSYEGWTSSKRQRQPSMPNTPPSAPTADGT